MDTSATVGAILRAVNDHTLVRPYGDGLLVDLPFTYGDGDSVRVLVEPMGTGFRVSDRAVAASLVSMAGANLSAQRPSEAFEEIIKSAKLNGLRSEAGELATFGPAEQLGQMILDVGQASLRVDQIRWLAVRQSPKRFTDQVAERVRSWAGHRQVQREASVSLKSGRQRQVTLRIYDQNSAAYVQAVSSRDQDQAAEHCYYIFDLSEIPKENKIAALDGGRDDWPVEIVEELKTVSGVEFFDDARSLERRIDKVVPPPQASMHASQ
ncbi:DUF1828 domain-containing protein [Actinoplanes sp. CA-131856]